jgi:hypothetical protein
VSTSSPSRWPARLLAAGTAVCLAGLVGLMAIVHEGLQAPPPAAEGAAITDMAAPLPPPRVVPVPGTRLTRVLPPPRRVLPADLPDPSRPRQGTRPYAMPTDEPLPQPGQVLPLIVDPERGRR